MDQCRKKAENMRDQLVRGLKPILDMSLFTILTTQESLSRTEPRPERRSTKINDEDYELDKMFHRGEVIYLRCEVGEETSRFKEWTKTELFNLFEYIKEHGFNYTQITDVIETKTRVQCKNRVDYIRRKIREGRIKLEDDELEELLKS